MSSSPLSRRSLLGLGGAGLLAATTAACGGSDETSGTTSAAPAGTERIESDLEPRTIRTCVYASNHASSPLFWERFVPEGWGVDVSVVTSSAEIQSALMSGQLDAGLIGTYSTLIAAEQEGFAAKVVGMVARGGLGLVAAAESGIAEVADLAGRRVAVPPPGQQVVVLTLLLREQGLALEDLQGVPLGYADHYSALVGGDVEAFMGSEPPCSQAVAEGAGVRVGDPFGTAVGDFNTALWASPQALEEPDFVRVLVEAQRRAAEYMSPGGENDPEVWRSLLVDSFGLTEEVYEEVLPQVGARWRMTPEYERSFTASADLMLEQGVLTREPDLEGLFAREFWEV